METARLHALVHGYVQGVNFRWYTRQQANHLGLSGYVRNRADGSVEVVAEGPRESLEQLLAWLHQGPSLASVERVDVSWEELTREFSSFEVRY